MSRARLATGLAELERARHWVTTKSGKTTAQEERGAMTVAQLFKRFQEACQE